MSAQTDSPRVAVAEGARSVAIAAPVRGAMIVTGDNNTVEMRLTGGGAVLAHVFRWDRPRARRRRDRRPPPARFENHVDRDAEIAALMPAGEPPRIANVYGPEGIGKTRVLVEAIHRGEGTLRDGVVFLDGRGRSADDLLHAAFDELYECRVKRRDLRVERLLSRRRALLCPRRRRACTRRSTAVGPWRIRLPHHRDIALAPVPRWRLGRARGACARGLRGDRRAGARSPAHGP